MKKLRHWGENYDLHWGFASFEGKTVLDLGAEYGTTAEYFLAHGAKKVIAVEGDSKHASELFDNYGSNPKVTCIEAFLESPMQFQELISKYKPDMVKVDIEGHERHLLEMPLEIISSIKEWLLETHDSEMFNAFKELFSSLGYKLSFHYHLNWVRVIWARK